MKKIGLFFKKINIFEMFFIAINSEKLADSKVMKVLTKFSMFFHLVLSCVLIFVIEAVSRHSVASACEFVISTPLTFLYNVFLIFATLLFAYLFKRRMVVRFIISVFWLLLGITNGCILASRVTPFNFTDLGMIGDLLTMKNSKYLTTGQEIAVVILLAFIAFFCVLFAIKGPKFRGDMHRVRNVAIVVAVVISLPFVTKAAISSKVLAGYFGNLAQGYKDYGFVYSFSASMIDKGMKRPATYSQSEIDRILNEEDKAETTLSGEELPNIIFVQLESFIDLNEVNFLELDQDPIPNFRNLMENYSSGHLTVPVVGAGTANTEFEVNTGMGIQFFGLGEYPYKTTIKDTPCESAAGALRNLGYGSSALHNNGGNFYSRAEVFGQMGFDNYLCKETMNITEYNELNSWAKDDILIDETMKALDNTPDSPDYIYTITVQSHGSYPEYEVFSEPKIHVTGAETPEENYQWEYMANELAQVDEFIGDLIAELEKRDEKTLLVLYGDHLPTMGLEDGDMARGNLYDTQYVTWNNFGMEKQDKDVEAYQLFAYMTERLGIHEGTMFTYHQSQMNAGNATEADAQYQNDMELLQYDILLGDKFAYGGEDLYPPTDIQIGVEEVAISNVTVSAEGDKAIIVGDNFTPWSKVFVNGEKLDGSPYVTSSVLHISLDELSEGCEIKVCQIGSGGTVFRESNAYIWNEAENN